MDAQRALLDSLMGFNRDGDRPDDDAMDFRHARVCKPYLFQNTRQDAGSCDLLHLPDLRTAYAEATQDLGYEQALASELSRMLADVEKKIARAQRRLAEDGDEQDRTQILQLTQDAQDAAAQAEQAAKDGDADRSLQLMERVELLKRKRRELLRQKSSAAGAVVDVNQKLRVCDVCGAFLSIFDSDQRLADHFGGKVHVGYVQIRSKLKELVQQSKDREESSRKEMRESPVKRRRRSVSRSRAREQRSRTRRERSTDRSRPDDRRDRGRSRSRERRRERCSRSRRRSASSSRSRSRERTRGRSRRHRR